MKKDELKYKDRGLRLALRHQAEEAGKLKLPEDFTDRLMQRIPQPEKKPVRRRLWLYPAAAVAAGVVLVVSLLFKYNKKYTVQPDAPVVIAEIAERPIAMVQTEEQSLMAEELASLTDYEDVGRRMETTPDESKPQPEELDTLGDEIWSQKKHVLLALQMLEECESACEQQRGNALIEAAFHASEHSDKLLLVVSETGDYMIVDESQKNPVVVL